MGMVLEKKGKRDEELGSFILRLGDEFPFYAETCLMLRSKSGRIVPFHLNRAQRYIHERFESQIEKTGKVRALVLKGRQQGCSTYVEGRFYHRVHFGKGLRAFILSHETDSALNLFNMAKRFHENCPEGLTPMTDRSNRQELVFTGQDCSYRVATAGAEAVGRSETIQLFHGSEVAFWPHADDHAAGAMQAVPDEKGTEIVLESTANGLANMFHQMWVKAERGESNYQAIFVPWFWQEEYISKENIVWQPTSEEIKYQESYGVSDEAMMWRRTKIAEIGEEKFRQEYPATAAEAFQTSGKGLLIQSEDIIAARKLKTIQAYGARVGGCDPAGDGFNGDRTVFVIRQGRVLLHFETMQGKKTTEIAARLAHLYQHWRLDRMFVEKDGLGAGVVDRAQELIHGVTGVNAGETPMQSDRFFNKRAEMWGLMAEWFADQPVSIPDDDELQADLQCMRACFDSNSRLKLESKAVIRKDFGRSPDIGDAMGLTFAYPVSSLTDSGGVKFENEAVKRRKEYRPGRSSRRST